MKNQAVEKKFIEYDDEGLILHVHYPLKRGGHLLF